MSETHAREQVERCRERLAELRARSEGIAGSEGGAGSAAQTAGSGAGDPTPAGETVGSSDDGAVTATAARGRLRSLVLASHVMRQPGSDLVAMIRQAVNQALERASVEAPAAPEEAVDLAALSDQLREAHERSARAIRMITGALVDVMAEVRERTGMRGDPNPHGVDELLHDVGGVLKAANPRSGDTEEGDGGAASRGGCGFDDEGDVKVEVDEGYRVVSIDLRPRATRLMSHRLGAAVLAAVNAALEDLATKRRAAGIGGGKAAEMSGAIRDIQDRSLASMRSYSRSLADIMASIQAP